jgi:hypothetical protein
MNGVPLMNEGKYAAFRRVRSGDDMRSNITAGGKVKRAKIDDVALSIADMVRPKLVMDGMFLVGLDIVGDKLMEINVFSPGGLGSAEEFEETDFTRVRDRGDGAEGAVREPGSAGDRERDHLHALGACPSSAARPIARTPSFTGRAPAAEWTCRSPRCEG